QHLHDIDDQTDGDSDCQNRCRQHQDLKQCMSANVYDQACRHQWKLLIREPTSRSHPSTITNRSNFKGVEITTGGNCNMPTEVVMDATTMSITMNGRNRIAPI